MYLSVFLCPLLEFLNNLIELYLIAYEYYPTGGQQIRVIFNLPQTGERQLGHLYHGNEMKYEQRA